MKEIITAPRAPVTGFTDAAKPAPIGEPITAGNMLCLAGQGPINAQRTGVNVEIDCVAVLD